MTARTIPLARLARWAATLPVRPADRPVRVPVVQRRAAGRAAGAAGVRRHAGGLGDDAVLLPGASCCVGYLYGHVSVTRLGRSGRRSTSSWPGSRFVALLVAPGRVADLRQRRSRRCST